MASSVNNFSVGGLLAYNTNLKEISYTTGTIPATIPFGFTIIRITGAGASTTALPLPPSQQPKVLMFDNESTGDLTLTQSVGGNIVVEKENGAILYADTAGEYHSLINAPSPYVPPVPLANIATYWPTANKTYPTLGALTPVYLTIDNWDTTPTAGAIDATYGTMSADRFTIAEAGFYNFSLIIAHRQFNAPLVSQVNGSVMVCIKRGTDRYRPIACAMIGSTVPAVINDGTTQASGSFKCLVADEVEFILMIDTQDPADWEIYKNQDIATFPSERMMTRITIEKLD